MRPLLPALLLLVLAGPAAAQHRAAPAGTPGAPVREEPRPPLGAGLVSVQTLAGVGGGFAVAAAASFPFLMAGFGGNTVSEDAVVGSILAGYWVGSALGVQMVSRRAGIKGSWPATLGGAALGVLGGPAVFLTMPLGAAIGFNRTRAYRHPPLAPPAETAACAVYRAVLRELAEPGAPPVLADSTLLPTIPAADWLREQAPSATPALLQSFAAENAATGPLEACPEIPAHRLPEAQLRALGAEGGPDDPWREFRRRYPASSGYLRLSRPGFGPDGRSALVYALHQCGGRCGRGAYLLLRRGPAGWRVEERVIDRAM